MQRDKPSRRRLLTGFLAGLIGWLFARRAEPAAPGAEPGLVARCEGPACATVTTCTYFTYDGLTYFTRSEGEASVLWPVTSAPATTYVYSA
jgi:hypothetical protein